MTLEEFNAILEAMPQAQPVIYRLYHDDQGHPLQYSMEDLPGTWISVDPAIYAIAPMDIKIVQGRIVQLPRQSLVRKLRPGQHGVCCHPFDVCLVVEETECHVRWSMD